MRLCCKLKNTWFKYSGNLSQLKKFMNLARFPLKVHYEPKCPMLEIIHAEKHLWSLIYSKGLLHKEAQELHVKVCLMYEKIILSDYQEVEFQEIEYSLWKLHYKHIHEFRKKISQSSKSTGFTESDLDSLVEKYKSFLMEATEFYQNLISKMGKLYGPGEDPLFKEKGDVSCHPVKLHKHQYSCHRFLVCLGDLARYRELCKNIDVQRRNWSVAATYYFKATSSWPDSGNAQNQLAVLAKYIDDDFLALYHCVRSLAVKEPFPDAWDNLILLLEENKSSHLESLSREAHFNFSNISERSSPPSECNIKNNEMQATDHTSSTKSVFWSLFVRLISLFFVESSSEEFPYTFASAMRELIFLLQLNDINLGASLESYQHMDQDRTGPYRALQLVSILVFIADTMTTNFDLKELKENTNLKQPDLVKSAFTTIFTILGRLTERCLKSNFVKSSPLLPAVLVFVEWFVGILDIVQQYVFQEEVSCSIFYFLDTFVELLNKFETQGKFKNRKDIALWEDFELRGFMPMARSHKLLKFSTREEPMGESVGENTRVHRIFDAAMKIVEKSPVGFRKWIRYDIEGEKFYTIGQTSSVHLDLKVPQQTVKENDEITNIIVVEEEEEIIFKPLARYNSAPIYSPEKETSTEGASDKKVPSDDSLRRAASLFAEQIRNFHSDSISSETNNPLNKHETIPKASATQYPAGPPSLNAWVLDKEKDKAARDFFKPRLCSIDEVGSLSLNYSPPYSAPIPSAPLLPDDAFLFRENSDIHDVNYSGILGVSPMSSASTYTSRPVFDGSLSFTPMSSSEWLHQFRNLNLNKGNNLLKPRFNPSNPNQIMYPEIPQLYAGSEPGFVADGLRRDNIYHNYKRLSPYGCGGDMEEIRAEKASLLQYLKEKEWQLQNQAQVRGPAYEGN